MSRNINGIPCSGNEMEIYKTFDTEEADESPEDAEDSSQDEEPYRAKYAKHAKKGARSEICSLDCKSERRKSTSFFGGLVLLGDLCGLARDELGVNDLIQKYREKLYRAKYAKRAKRGDSSGSFSLGILIQRTKTFCCFLISILGSLGVLCELGARRFCCLAEVLWDLDLKYPCASA